MMSDTLCSFFVHSVKREIHNPTALEQVTHLWGAREVTIISKVLELRRSGKALDSKLDVKLGLLPGL